MKVKVRMIEDASDEARDFTTIQNEKELDELIKFIERSGGINDFSDEGSYNTEKFHSYQLVMTSSEVYVEIILGEES